MARSLAILFTVLLFTAISLAEQNDWVSRLALAERLSCDISFARQRAIWPSDSAKQLAWEAYALVNPKAPDADSARAAILICLGDYHMRDSSVAQADSSWSAAAAFAANIHPTNAALRRAIAWRQMIMAEEQGDERRADSLENLALSDTSVDASLVNRLTYLHELVGVYVRLLRFKDNWRIDAQIAQEWRANQRGDAKVVVIALMDLAEGASKFLLTNVQSRFAEQDSAIKLGEEALQIARTRLGTADASVGYVLNRLGDYYVRRGDRARAIQYWNEAYKINLAALPLEHIECQGSIDRLGGVAASEGEYSRAIELITHGIKLRKQTQGEGHQEVASLTSNLAGLYRQMGQFARAESLYNVALEIRRKALPPDHPDIASSFNSLGKVCFDQGRTAEAETYWRRALGIRETVLGANDAATVSILQNLAVLYDEWGRSDDAEEMLDRVLRVKRKFLGADHPEVAFGYLDLAKLHIKQRKLPLAHVEANKALAILGARGDSLDSDALMTIAEIDKTEGQLDKADSLVRLVIDIVNRRDGESNFRLIRPLVEHAEYLRDRGDLVQSDTVYQRAIAIAESVEITKSTRMSELLSSYGELQLRSNRVKEGQRSFARAYQIALAGFQDAVQVLPEFKAARFAGEINKLRDKFISSLFADDDQRRQPERSGIDLKSVAVDEFAAVILSGRAIVSESVLEHRAHLMNSNNKRVSPLLDSLRDVSLQLARAQIENDADSSFAKFDRRLKRLAARKLFLEESLVHLGYEIGDDPGALILSEDKTINLLRENSPLIEFVKYYSATRRVTQYAAFIANRGSLRAINLGAAEPIEDAIGQVGLQMSAMSETGGDADSNSLLVYLAVGQKIAASVWQPLSKFMPDSGQMFVIPDGALNSLSFGSLPTSTNSFLIEQYQFSYLNSIRDLNRDVAPANRQSGLLALGDPNFTADLSKRFASTNPEIASYAPGSNRNSAARGILANCRIPRESLTPLVASRSEVESAGRIWRAAHSQPVNILVGDAASEENFKRLASGNEIIHLATHAYFLSHDCFPKALEEVTTANPLLLSGLLLAGAAVLAPADSALVGEDGVLSGEEIAAMDLHGTKCVVLSACESGLGTVNDGEGVYGLRRAFQLTGVETIVSTLWNVPDQSTARLMQRLYTNLQEGFASAVRKAQLATIRELRDANMPPHPYSWGAFIVVGK